MKQGYRLIVVDKDGVVRHIFENVTPAGHAGEVLDFVRSLAEANS